MKTGPAKTHIIEILEPRIAPAAVFSYVDGDSDKVVITTSKGTNAQLAAAITLAGGTLVKIDFSGNVVFAGTDLSIVATRDPEAGGTVAVGRIDATAIDGGTAMDLGTVFVDGDLDAIDAGDGVSATAAIKSLTVSSMGRYFAPGDDVASNVNGAIGKLVVKTDFKEILLNVLDTGGGANGKIGSITIGGSILGGGEGQSGQIFAGDGIGPVKVGRDIVGGEGSQSGTIQAGRDIASIAIGGSLIGGTGTSSGRISATAMGTVKIGHDVRGGPAVSTGEIFCGGKLAGVSIGGSLIGGVNAGDFTDFSGRIFSGGDMGPISIRHDVQGGSGLTTGAIQATGKIAALSVGGSLIGGPGHNRGSISAGGDIGPVKIGRDVRGGSAVGAGKIGGDTKIASVSIGGSVIGGSKSETGVVTSGGDMGPVLIGGSVIGGTFMDETATRVGAVVATGAIGSLSIDGDIRGGDLTALNPINIHNVSFSGFVGAKQIGKVAVGGSIVAGDGIGVSAFTLGCGSLRVADSLGAVSIGGSLIGSLSNPAVITARGQATPSAAGVDVAIKSLTVLGSVQSAEILAGYSTNGLALNADAQIGKVTIGGDWIQSDLVAGAQPGNGLFGDGSDIKISGGGTTDEGGTISKIAGIVIKGQVIGSLSGLDNFGFVAQQIGSFSVGGTGIALAAGPENDVFSMSNFRLLIGDLDDVRIVEIAL